MRARERLVLLGIIALVTVIMFASNLVGPGIILLLFANDFVTISVSTDRVRFSSEPEKWDVTRLVKISLILSIFPVIELFGLLFIGERSLHVSPAAPALQTFGFVSVFYFAVFTILSVRERKHFWNSVPDKYMSLALGADMIVIGLIATTGLPGLAPIAPIDVFAVVAYTAAVFLIINDTIKFVLMKKLGIQR